MPAKKQIPREKIMEAALELLEESGMESINVRALAAKLKCSTQPIYLSFQNMEECKAAVEQEAYRRYESFLKQELAQEKYPKYKRFGMGYIRFACTQPGLFRFLFLRKRTEQEQQTGSPDFQEAVSIVMQMHGWNYEKALLFQLEMWIFVHGIATMAATDFLSLTEGQISDAITDMYQGLLMRYTRKEDPGDKTDTGN